jgi:hypothetical protein
MRWNVFAMFAGVFAASGLVAWWCGARKWRRTAFALSTLTLCVVAAYLAMWGMRSSEVAAAADRYPVTDSAQRVFLGCAGGLFAQSVLGLHRLRFQPAPALSIPSLYLDGATGIICGVIGTLVFALPFDEIEKMSKHAAAVGGISGGALGATLVMLLGDNLRKRLSQAQETKKPG